jgi:hypothetical protein
MAWPAPCVGTPGELHPGRALDRHHREVRRAAHAGAGDGDRLGRGARRFHQVAQRTVRCLVADKDGIGFVGQQPGIGEAVHAIARRVVEQRGDQGGEGDERDVAAVGRCRRHLVQHQHAAGAGLVHDDDLRAAAEMLFQERRRHARGEVDIPARREAHIDLHGAVLCVGDQGGQRQRTPHQGPAHHPHGLSPA